MQQRHWFVAIHHSPMKATKLNTKQLQVLNREARNAHRIIDTGTWYAQQAYATLSDPNYTPSAHNNFQPAHHLAQWQFDRAHECINDATTLCNIIIAFFIKLKIQQHS